MSKDNFKRLTEDEARNRACCGPEQCGKYDPDVSLRLCIGSACMAWRWNSSVWNKNTDAWLQPGERHENFEIRLNGFGHCGLAGAP